MKKLKDIELEIVDVLYVEAPNRYVPQENDTTIFLAGGISNCPNWQVMMADRLLKVGLTVLNPRRENFPMDDPSAAHSQIAWEYQHIHNADAVLFWFPAETLCPITLFELGAQSMNSTPLFVGVNRAYQRRLDVEIQLKLARPDVTIVYTLDDLVEQISDWVGERTSG